MPGGGGEECHDANVPCFCLCQSCTASEMDGWKEDVTGGVLNSLDGWIDGWKEDVTGGVSEFSGWIDRWMG